MTRNDWLLKEASKWKEEGSISEQFFNELHIRYPKRVGFQSTSIFFIIATIFLGLSVLTFIAANWDGIPVVVRLLVLLGSMVTCYALAEWKAENRLQSFLLDLGGLSLFGASIFLIGQMFHIVAYNGYALLIWAIFALYYCHKHRSHVIGIFATALFLLSYGIEALEFSRSISFSLMGIIGLYLINRVLKDIITSFGFYAFLGLSTVFVIGEYGINLEFLGLALVAPFIVAGSYLFQSRSITHNVGEKLVLWVVFLQLTFLIHFGQHIIPHQTSIGPIWILVLSVIVTLGIYGYKLLNSKVSVYLPVLYFLAYCGIVLYVYLSSMYSPPFYYAIDVTYELFKWIFLILLLFIGFVRFLERDIEGLLFFCLTVFIFYIQATWGLLNKSLFFLLGAILLFGIGFWWKKKGVDHNEVA
jgi:uncharacterized membrane protein